MRDKNNLESSDYITSVSNCFISNTEIVDHNGITNIVITDDAKDLHFYYKGKKYAFDIEKALKLLCKELENDK